jgi:hypothetical protein
LTRRSGPLSEAEAESAFGVGDLCFGDACLIARAVQVALTLASALDQVASTDVCARP